MFFRRRRLPCALDVVALFSEASLATCGLKVFRSARDWVAYRIHVSQKRSFIRRFGGFPGNSVWMNISFNGPDPVII